MNCLPNDKKINSKLAHLKSQLFNTYFQAIQLFYILYK